MRGTGSRHDNPFTDPRLVEGYEAWYEGPGRRADRLERALLGRLLGWVGSVATVLEVGCGTGHFTRWLARRGLEVVALDPSWPMLVEAGRLGTPRMVRGDAHRLPLRDAAVDLVLLVTVLEFVAEPGRALREAVRVARRGVVVGALNRRSRLGRLLAWSPEEPWRSARFLEPRELAGLARAAAGARLERLRWRTTLWRWWPSDLPAPGGGFIGLAVRLRRAATPAEGGAA